MVKNVESETPDNTTLVLNWQPPDPTNGDILNYTVKIRVNDGDVIITVTNTTFTATNLSKQSSGFPT